MNSSGLNYYVNASRESREKLENMRIKEAQRLFDEFTKEISEWRKTTYLNKNNTKECIKIAK